jgi:hypothetical protein
MRGVFAVSLLMSVAGCPSGESSSPDLGATGDDLAAPGGSPDLATGTTPANVGTMTVLTYNSGGQAGYMLVSAGTVTVTGGATTPVTLAIQQGSYYIATGTTALFNGGETLVFATSGATAPASTTTLVAPTPPTLTTPGPLTSYTLSRAADYPFVWTGVGPGTLEVVLQINPGSLTPGTKYGGVRCSFRLVDGSGMIPSAALSLLPAGNGQLNFGAANVGRTIVGDWLMQATAGTYPKSSAGTQFAGGTAVLN